MWKFQIFLAVFREKIPKICYLSYVRRRIVWINTLAQRWANVHRWLVITGLNCVGYITLGQHWTNVCLPLWFWIKVCWKYYVGQMSGQCTPVTCFSMTELRWAHYVGPTLDQGMPATLVLDKSLLRILRWPKSLLRILRWPNVGPHRWLV